MGAFLGPDQCRNDVISGTEARQADVRFGSKADTVTSPRHVRFTPDNGRWAVQVGVRKVPIADIRTAELKHSSSVDCGLFILDRVLPGRSLERY